MPGKRNPDWNGHAPKNDDEARHLIIQAAQSVAQRDGIARTNIKKVADELGITRQTVYRLFPSTDDLLTQVSIAAGGKILDRLLKQAMRHEIFADRVIESMVFLARNIPKDEFLKQYFRFSEGNDYVNAAFEKESLDYAFQMLKTIHGEAGLSPARERWLMGLAEHLQRILLGMIVAPSSSLTKSRNIKEYLNKWLRPLLE